MYATPPAAENGIKRQVCCPCKPLFAAEEDGERIAGGGGNWFTRSFGTGYPDLDSVVEQLVEKRRASDVP